MVGGDGVPAARCGHSACRVASGIAAVRRQRVRELPRWFGLSRGRAAGGAI